VDGIANRLIELGVRRLALAGGVAPHLERLLAPSTRQRLVKPVGDPLYGAFLLARAASVSTASAEMEAGGSL
jgi:N-acetylglucosamine kinase-like BadF-type ATPase